MKSKYQKSVNIVPATVNACELLAVADAIHYWANNCGQEPLEIRTDSLYVINGWKNPESNKKNKDIWKLISELKRNQNIQITHVKAHQSEIYNNHVDKLAKTKLREYVSINYG